jgi:hypothetical protein
MRQVAVFAVSILSLLSLSSGARAGAFDYLAQSSCEQAVDDKIKAGHSDASDIGYTNPKINQTETKSSVNGRGHFTAGSGKVNFSYTCSYDIVSGDASNVSLQVGKATASN